MSKIFSDSEKRRRRKRATTEAPRRRRATTEAPRRRRATTEAGEAKNRTALSSRIERGPKLRIRIAATALTGLFAIIGVQAFALQIEQGDSFRQAADNQHQAKVAIPAPRGRLLDGVGRELAGVADVDSVWADPSRVQDVTQTADALATILGTDVRVMEARLASRKRFVWLKRHLSTEEATAIREGKFTGVHLASEPRRFYPGQAVAGPVLGFANVDGRGLDGIELTMDELLAGRRASRNAVRDSRGRLMMADGGAKPLPGATIKLSLDRNIQHIAEQALVEAVAEHQAKSAVAVILDVKTSAVLAMANVPTFDPNQPHTRKKARNRAVTDAYEVGSIMKPVTISLALDAGVIKKETTFDVSDGSILIGRKRIRDSYRGDKILDVGGVLKRSSNVGTIQIARRLGKEALHRGILKFGFGAKTDIELPGERRGVIHPTKRWGEIGLASMSYGYMMTSTPLQVAAAYATIGNGGVYHEPRIVKKVTDPDGEVLYQHESKGRRVISQKTADMLLPMLASVFEKGKKGGSARNVVVPGYRAGGKTGTAHKIDPATKTYSKSELYLSSFAGLAPIDNPRIAVVVLVDEPHGEHHYGGSVAGPAWGKMVSRTLKYLGEPATEVSLEKQEAAKEESNRQASAPPLADDEAKSPDEEPEAPFDSARQVMVPDFKGLSMGRALREAREAGIALVIEGSGKAVSQHPLPGPAEIGTECRIVFAQQ